MGIRGRPMWISLKIGREITPKIRIFSWGKCRSVDLAVFRQTLVSLANMEFCNLGRLHLKKQII